MMDSSTHFSLKSSEFDHLWNAMLCKNLQDLRVILNQMYLGKFLIETI
jgi:hypothetical protein